MLAAGTRLATEHRMTIAQIRTILGTLVALSSTVMACAKQKATEDTTFARHLGDSTKSPGSNPTRPAPQTSDDPARMNVSMGIRAPANPEIAPPGTQPRTAPVTAPTTAPTTAPRPASPNATVNPNTSVAAPNANPRPAPDPATSSTPVAPPADITPPSTNPEPPRPGVFSPPPPSDSP